MQVLLIIGAVQALFFALLIFNKKGKRLPDKILAFWLLVFSLHLSYIYFIFQRGYSAYFEYGGYDSAIIILYYSLMYIYAKSIITNSNKFNLKWLLHLIPTGLVYISMIPYLALDYKDKIALIENNISQNLYINISVLAIVIFITIYIVFIFRLLNKHLVNIKRSFSFEEKINLAWLKNLSIILAIIWIAFSIIIFYVFYIEYTSNSSSIEFYTNLELYGYCLFVAFIYLLGYFGYKQGNIFSYKKTNTVSTDVYDEIEVSNKNSKTPKENKATKSEDEAFVDTLYKYMIDQKPYLEHDLSLFQLAKELNVSTHYLSNILNNNIHKNFYEFINHYRVDEVKKRIASNKTANFTILAIALDCGFNSKATFNRIFKNYTGYTPSQFQQDCK